MIFMGDTNIPKLKKGNLFSDTEAAGYTGDVKLEVPATTVAGQEFAVWCEWIKHYE